MSPDPAPAPLSGDELEPLRLLAHDEIDLQIISAALQDALMLPGDIRWDRPARTLTLSMDRFCWERGGARVRAALQFGDVQAVSSRELERKSALKLELLAIDFIAGEAPGGDVLMMFAGGADLRARVECLDAVLADIDRPYKAKAAPKHADDVSGSPPEPA